jgi:hypothetical protein
VQLVYTVAVVHDLESSHHVARYACLLLISYLLTDGVVLSYGFSELVVVVSLCLKPSFDGFYVVLTICMWLPLAVMNRDMLRVDFTIVTDLIVANLLGK